MVHFPDDLLSGYRAFKTGRFADERARYQELAEKGQKPDCMVVACCDSRAGPETIFNTSPGQIFVVRNVANIIPPFDPDGGIHATSAALEYGLQVLDVRQLVVLGHGRCGGIQAALDPDADPLSPGDFIGRWMDLLTPAAEAISNNAWLTSQERQTALERINIRNSIANLRTFPRVVEREQSETLSLHGAWFDIQTGELWTLDVASGEFTRPIMDA